jgi:transglutaminase-like putative cysteine protease
VRVYSILHKTIYRYVEEVSLCQNEAHLRPRETASQRCTRHELIITPRPRSLVRRLDYFGNPTHAFAVEDPHRTLEVTSISQVEVIPSSLATIDNRLTTWEQVRDEILQSKEEASIDARSLVLASPLVEELEAVGEYAAQSFPAGRDWLESIRDVCRRIYQDFAFDPTSTTVSTPITEVLEHRRGVCQDFAHLAIAILRNVGLPARYVSGYIETDPPEGRPRLVGADASHAWVATFAPGIGWIDFDPTNNLLPADRHIVLGWGRDYGDVTPLKGVVIGGGVHSLDVSVDVVPLTTTNSSLSSSQIQSQ